VIDISREYLGPAAERFVNRQISVHLKKEPQNLTKKDLPKLVDWVRLAFALLTNDSALVDEYIGKLLAVAKNKPADI
jgi:hypothetical protein